MDLYNMLKLNNTPEEKIMEELKKRIKELELENELIKKSKHEKKLIKKSEYGNELLKKELGIGYILNKGLPPINIEPTKIAGYYYKPSKFINDNAEFNNPLNIVEKDFKILNNIYKKEWENEKSLIWMDYSRNKNAFKRWNSESDIQKHVHSTLKEIVDCYLNDKKLEIYSQTYISSAIQYFVADLSVIKSVEGNVLGVCEVKRPDIDSLSNKEVITDIINYMQELHYTYHNKYVFGILTSYNKWKIFWLSNTDRIANAETTTEIDQIIEQDLLNEESNNIDDNVVYCSQEYDYSDKNIAMVLISCLYKMSIGIYNNPVSFKNNKSKFRLVSSKFEKYPQCKLLPDTHNITYKYPTKKTTNFYLMQDYHGGRDGYVWLAATCSENNINIIVIKFSKLLSNEKKYYTVDEINEVRLDSLENEASNWENIWNIKPRVEKILDQPCIIMPFVFHCKMIKDKIFFMPPYKWVKEDDEIPFIFENKEINDNELFDMDKCDKYINDPILVAKEAIRNMLDMGYLHNDIKWSHVGLLPIKEDHNGDRLTLKPILIDLTDVEYIGIKSQIEKDTLFESLFQKLMKKLNLEF